MKKKIYLMAVIVTLLMTIKVNSQSNTNPAVTDVAFSITGTTVTVNYKVADAEQSSVTIRMEVSSNGGTSWDFNYGAASGNIGEGVTTGTDLKTITWTYSGGYNEDFKIRIIADDLVGDQIYYAGKTYNTVQIGTQCWLKENLNIGTMIQSTTGGTNGDGNQTNNSNIEKYCYNNDVNNCTTYGGLYQWAEAVQYQNGATNASSPSPAFTGNVQGICPVGWHIPTYAELQTLKNAVGNDGNVLKAVGQGSGNGAGTNTSGFSALLAGYRHYYNWLFQELGNGTYFWSSTEYDNNEAFRMNLWHNDSSINMNNRYKDFGFSVRCVKD